jgi:hypothetical protein
MAYYQVSRLVITDERDMLMGVISLSDIAEREPAKRAGPDAARRFGPRGAAHVALTRVCIQNLTKR